MANGNEDLARFLEGVKNDLLALEAAVEGVTAQLDADAGVTDTDYASSNNPTLETS